METIKTFEEIYPAFELYKPFVEKVFNYLNGYINPNNPCQLYINMYSNNNYAEFAKPNHLICYLGSIINNFFGNDNEIRKIIIITIAHELCHSEQSINMIQYTNDPYYRQSMENQNEGYSEKWLNIHSNEIQQLFGVEIRFSDFAIRNIQPHAKDWTHASIRDHYFYTIMDVVFRNQKFITPLNDAFDCSNTISFHINDSGKVLLKYRGEYNTNGIYLFNKLINDYCREGNAIRYFSIKTRMSEEEIFGEKGMDIHLTLSNNYYKPIEF